MEAWPASSSLPTSSEHGARLLRPTGGEYLAAQRASLSFRTRSRARSGPQMRHPERLEERALSQTGPGGGSAERSLIKMAEMR